MNQPMDWQGIMLGRYRLLQQIGRGGMGEVWLAEDTQLRRQVAVKLLPRVHADDARYLEAFTYEARAAAALEHPNILPVHDFGKEQLANGDVVTYLIMPHIAGGSLREWMGRAQTLLPLTESLNYLKQAGQAIDYAHSRQVLHRDVKPGNMLLQQQWLFLTDFGLAKLLASTTQRSQTHAGAGTPEYMAPEQSQGQAVTASDRYSLAVIAYRLLAGVLPFKGNNPYEMIIQHINMPVPSARQLNPALSEGVDAVLVKGLAKRPEDRFASCGEFVTALGQTLGIRHTTTHNDDPDATVLAPWSRRQPSNLSPDFNPLHINNSASTITASTTANYQPRPAFIPPAPPASPDYNQSVIQYHQSYQPTAVGSQNPVASQATFPANGNPMQADQLMQQEQISRSESGTKKRKVSRRALLIGGGTAVVAVAAVATTGALILPQLTANPAPKPAPVIPGPQKLVTGVPLLTLSAHSDTITNVVWDPSGRYVATAGQDTRVMLWNVAQQLRQKPDTFQTITSPDKQWKFANGITYSSLSWSHDGKHLIITPGTTTQASLLTAFGASTVMQNYAYSSNNFSLPGYQIDVAWSPTNNTFATDIYSENTIALWQQNQVQAPTKLLKYTSQNKNAPLDLSNTTWSRDGEYIAAQSSEFTVPIWNVKTGKLMQSLQMPERTKQHYIILERSALKFSPLDAGKLATSDIDAVLVYDTLHNKLLYSLGTNDLNALTLPKNDSTGWIPQVGSVTWAPNGRYIAASYGRSNQVYIWNLNGLKSEKKNGLIVQNMLFGLNNGHSATIMDLAWSPDGRYIATASADKTVIIWRVDGNL
jgi:Serine/threonine protein kinase